LFSLVNSAFHPSGVGKLSTGLHWLGLRQGVFACVGWQVILCDPIWQATPRSSEMNFHYELTTAFNFFKWQIHWRNSCHKEQSPCVAGHYTTQLYNGAASWPFTL